MDNEIEVLQGVIGQYAEENANMRIIIERQTKEILKLRKENETKEESGDN